MIQVYQVVIMQRAMSEKKQNTINSALKSNVNEHFNSLMIEKNFIECTNKRLNINDLPPWYDEHLFKLGQQFANSNVLSVSLAAFTGLLSVLTIPSVLNVLNSTNQSGTPCTAFKRYAQTLLHIQALYKNNINDPKGRWWMSLNTIRQKHAIANKLADNKRSGNILQRDMCLTQFGFIGYVMIAPEKIGISSESIGIVGFNHLWRVIGYLIGVPDNMNICRDITTETVELCQKIANEVIVELIKNQSELCEKMISALIDGFSCVDVALNADSILHLWYELHEIKYNKQLSYYSQLNIIYRNTILYLFDIRIIGQFIRSGFNCYLNFNYWLVEQWPIIAYLRFGKKQSKINLYPYDDKFIEEETNKVP